MPRRKPITPSIVLNSTPAGSAITETVRPEESAVPLFSSYPRFPVAVWTPRSIPVIIGPCGLWSKALIETMFASSKLATFVLSPENTAKEIVRIAHTVPRQSEGKTL